MAELFDTSNPQLTASDHKIIAFFANHPQLAPFLSISEVTETIGISNATLTRFAKKTGFANYKELKQAWLTQQRISPSEKLEKLRQEAAPFESANALIQREIQHLNETAAHLQGESFQQAARAITQKKQVYVFSKGATKALGDLLYFRLNRFGIAIQHLCSSGSEIFETLAHITNQDVLILFGFGKIPKETNVILSYAKEHHITTLLFSDQLYYESHEPTLHHFYVSRGLPDTYHSLTTAIALIDAFIVEVSQLAPEAYQEKLQQLHTLKEQYKKEIPR